MSKKDYIAIADIFNRIVRLPGSPEAKCLAIMAKEMATYCQRDNERFDRGQFLAACGVQAGDSLC